jgi:hypothetical protein
MSDDKLQTAITRAARAKALVEDELLAEAFSRLETDYVAAWKSWAAADTAGRERLWMAVNVLARVRDHLNTVIANGKIARRRLEELTRPNYATNS